MQLFYDTCNLLFKTPLGKGIAAGYEALGMSLRSPLGIGGKNLVFMTSALSDGVIAMPDCTTKLEIVGTMRGKWRRSFAQ